MSEITMRRIDGRHVLAGLAVFFAVMLLANAVFVYFAVTTFGGVDTEDAYRKGIAYNRALEDAATQTGLGWKISLAYDGDRGSLTLTVADAAGLPVSGLDITGRLLHPATTARDVTLERFEDHGNGRYLRALDPTVKGAWIGDLVVQSDQEPPIRMRQRLWLPPKS